MKGLSDSRASDINNSSNIKKSQNSGICEYFETNPDCFFNLQPFNDLDFFMECGTKKTTLQREFSQIDSH